MISSSRCLMGKMFKITSKRSIAKRDFGRIFGCSVHDYLYKLNQNFDFKCVVKEHRIVIFDVRSKKC